MSDTSRLYDLQELQREDDRGAAAMSRGVRAVRDVWRLGRRIFNPAVSKKLLETATETYYQAPHGQRYKIFRTTYGALDCMLITEGEYERAQRRIKCNTPKQ